MMPKGVHVRPTLIVTVAAVGMLAVGLGIRTIPSVGLLASVQSSPSPLVCTSDNSHCTQTEIQLAKSALPIVVTPAHGTPLTRDIALSQTAGQTGVILRNTQMSAKLTTWGTYQAAAYPDGSGPTTGYAASEQIWLVAVSGSIKPGYAHGMVFPWAVFVYDAATSVPLGMNAGPKGTWPPYFDSLPDLAG